ncbi:MAG: NADH-quinone oxidoreductase subunit NuoB [Chloroflexi bacterium]|nr:MAG: NADH-quinone oxidoreductase subunit NuoB [Chloroflexota bacterium]
MFKDINQSGKQFSNNNEDQPACALLHSGGTCFGCAIEVVTLETPRYEGHLTGFRVNRESTEAKVLICTGFVTHHRAKKLAQTYQQMNGPKYVIAVGTCALSCGVFYDSYNAYGPVDRVIPVDMYIPGCPPRPGAILAGLEKLLMDQGLCVTNTKEALSSLFRSHN